MPDDHNLFPLIQFDKAVFLPLSRRRNSWGNKSDHSRALHLSELVEAYFWLMLGTELDYFPRRFAEKLARHRFTELFDGLPELFLRWSYLFAPDFRVLLETSRSRGLVGLSTRFYEFQNPKRLHKYFQHALTLEAETLRDDNLISAMAALTLFRVPDLENLLAGNKVQEGQLSARPGLLEDEFPKTMMHMRSFTTLDKALDNADIDGHDRAILKARIHELTRWRLNFRVDTVERFFPLVADSYFAQYEESVRLDYAQFRTWLAESVADWGFTHYSVSVSGAG